MTDTSVHPSSSHVAVALTVEQGYVVLTDSRVAVPPGVIAADGVDVSVSVVVCKADDVSGTRVEGVPSLVVELEGDRAFPASRRLAWQSLGLPERWSVAPDGVITVDTPTAALDLKQGDHVRRQGPGWSCDAAVADLLAS